VGGLRLLRSYVVFHLMRWFPTWAGWLPRHEPTIALAQAAKETGQAEAGETERSHAAV
jgi:cardiolipin synthase